MTVPSDAPMRVKCLIVDDLEENLLALSVLLRRDDVELLKAHSGAEALELLLIHDVALAFLDVQMPDMDGFELAELMRGSERTRHVPIIFVTAGARDHHRVFKGYESGAVDFLYKPIESHVLRSKADVFFQLYRQRQMLNQQIQVVTETLRLNEMFTAVLGHDLRNPLNAILTTAEILQRRSDDEGIRKTAVRLQAIGTRMGRMIEDMLDLARARLAGGIPLRRTEGSLSEPIHRVVQEHQSAHPDRRIQCIDEGDPFGLWDGDRLAQVVSNLLGNAIKHGDPAEPMTVRLDGRRPDWVVVSVSNAGRIPADVLPVLFDPFRGGQRAAGRGEGLGLGLFIVQQIVHAHGGSVEVDPGTSGVTTFSVRVPRGLPAGRAHQRPDHEERVVPE